MKTCNKNRLLQWPFISIITTLYMFLNLARAEPVRFFQNQQQSFDFIVVGGGTAGCAVARRLSDNGKLTVLLLEAGGFAPEVMSIPAFAKRNQINPSLTYQYQTTPQTRSALENNGVGISPDFKAQIQEIPAGRVLGGSSNVNYMIFNRGSPYDYDNWANITGDSSWKYSNMLKYFKKSESYYGEYPSNQHGYKGPMPVSFQKYAPGKEQWLAAGKELGYIIADPNGPQRISFTPVEFTRMFVRRVSSFDGYLKPVMEKRKNLKVVINAFATQLIFEGKKAVGVKYWSNGTRGSGDFEIVYATKEIILSAGAYNSPILLQKSGIGPLDLLRKANIPVVKELPVGYNFQEHPIVPIQMVLGDKTLAMDFERDLNEENFELYKKFGEGPYSSVQGYAGQAFIATSVAKKEGYPNWADIQLALTSITTRLQAFQNVTLTSWETTVIIHVVLARGKSRGSVMLNPTNINGPPIIDYNYFSDPLDEQMYLEGINATLEIFEGTKVYKRVGARYLPDSVPACRNLKFRSEAYWRCYMRQTTTVGGFHAAGTCSMNMVVDSKLRVIGTERLRVVDASIMPFVTNSNLQAAIYGIAEKASDSILNDWLEHH